jgi:hypothetical protein
MNKKSNAKDMSTPYRTLGIGKVSAPKTNEGEPKSRVITGTQDLRIKGGKA